VAISWVCVTEKEFFSLHRSPGCVVWAKISILVSLHCVFIEEKKLLNLHFRGSHLKFIYCFCSSRNNAVLRFVYLQLTWDRIHILQTLLE